MDFADSFGCYLPAVDTLGDRLLIEQAGDDPGSTLEGTDRCYSYIILWKLADACLYRERNIL